MSTISSYLVKLDSSYDLYGGNVYYDLPFVNIIKDSLGEWNAVTASFELPISPYVHVPRYYFHVALEFTEGNVPWYGFFGTAPINNGYRYETYISQGSPPPGNFWLRNFTFVDIDVNLDNVVKIQARANGMTPSEYITITDKSYVMCYDVS